MEDLTVNIKISVYPLTDGCISYVLDDSCLQPIITSEIVPFIILDEGFKYFDNDKDYIEYTGRQHISESWCYCKQINHTFRKYD